MNVLVFNAGSASLKFEVISASDSTNSNFGSKLVSAIIEGIGDNAVLSQQEGKNVIHQEQITAHDYEEATQQALEWLGSQLKEINIAGHRVVHGGNQFTAPVLINEQVIAEIEALEELAPLHNSPAVSVIRAARAKLGSDMAMVAVFDTVFHRSLPERAKLYAIPPELSERHRIQRYGFHGSSHQYITTRYVQIVGTRKGVNIITLHLESGCSATAIQAGKSVDTSMGFTPLEGLMMGKRSGDIDPAIVGYLARKEGVDVSKVEDWLNKKSGLLGISGLSHDTRELMKHYNTDERVRLALEIFCYRIRKYIGAYLAVLGGAEAIVFGGGIGENTPLVRAKVCEGLEWCGLKLDRDRNQQVINYEGRISTDDSHLHAYVIPTEEGLMIAQEAIRCVG